MDNDHARPGDGGADPRDLPRGRGPPSRHYHRSPDQLSAAEVQAYLVYMLREEHPPGAPATSPCRRSGSSPARRWGVPTRRSRSRTAPAQDAPRDPEPPEVRRLLEASTPGSSACSWPRPTRRASGSARWSGLRLQDIDAERMKPPGGAGEGGKDRYTLLSPRLLEELRAYWREYRPPQWLFAAAGAQRPLDVSTAQKFYLRGQGRPGSRSRAASTRSATPSRTQFSSRPGRPPHDPAALGHGDLPHHHCAISTWPARPSCNALPAEWLEQAPPTPPFSGVARGRGASGAGSTSPPLSARRGRPTSRRTA